MLARPMPRALAIFLALQPWSRRHMAPALMLRILHSILIGVVGNLTGRCQRPAWLQQVGEDHDVQARFGSCRFDNSASRSRRRALAPDRDELIGYCLWLHRTQISGACRFHLRPPKMPPASWPRSS